MRGDDHVCLSLATAILCMSPFLTTGLSPDCLWCCVCFLTGVFFGSYLPDMDLAAAQGLRLRSCTGFVVSAVSIVLVSMVRVLYRVAGWPFDGRHRESLHTVWGVSVATVVIAVLTGILFEDAGFWSYHLLYGYAGLFCGGMLHLAEDCCTMSGLQPFQPVSPLHMNGGIHTGDSRDHRPVWYARCLVCIAAGVIAGQYVYHIPAGELTVQVFVITLFSWVVFFLLSKHRYVQNR